MAADGGARIRGVGSDDMLTADELAKYLHRRRDAAVLWADRHGLALSCDDGPDLYRVGDVVEQLKRDRDLKNAPRETIPDLPLALAEVTPWRGGPRNRRAR